MYRFALIHDGSAQGWRTAYLAFHVATRLGASLRVLVVDSANDKESLMQRIKQTKIAGHAAGVSVETRIIADVSPDTITSNSAVVDGLFVPNHLVPDEETTTHLLKVISCPLWIGSEETETRKMVVLVETLAETDDLISYAANLSQRMNVTLTGLIAGESPSPATQSRVDITWVPVEDFSLPAINYALDQLHADLLFVHPSQFTLVSRLSCTCVICPASVSA